MHSKRVRNHIFQNSLRYPDVAYYNSSYDIAWNPNQIFWNRCDIRNGLISYGSIISVLRDLARMAWRRAYWIRYCLECVVRKLAENYVRANWYKSDFDGSR